MGTRLDGRSRSVRGIGVDTEGHVMSLSVETGYPLPLSQRWVAEPQLQIIYQRVDLQDQDDGIAHLGFDSQAYTTGRIGVRFKGHYQVSSVPIEPYLRANLWHTKDGHDTLTFDHAEQIRTAHRSTTGSIGAGMVATLSSNASLHWSADYLGDLGEHGAEGGTPAWGSGWCGSATVSAGTRLGQSFFGLRMSTASGGRFSTSESSIPCAGSASVMTSPPLPKLEPA